MRKKLFSFIVIAQKTIGSDGCAARANYLLSETHENHVRAGTKIISVHGKAEQVATEASLNWAKSNQQKYEKGGRPNYTFGMEYMFSPPKGYKLTKKQGKQLVREVVTAIAPKLGLSPKELARLSYSCIHAQDNDHLNIWFSTITSDGRNIYSKGLSRSSITNIMRRTFNDYCLREYGLNINSFVPERVSLASKNWQRINDEKKVLKEEQKVHEKIDAGLKRRCAEIDKKENILRKILPAQIQKWIDYLRVNNTKRVRSTENRVLKSAFEIAEYDDQNYLNEIVEKAKAEKRIKFADDLNKILDNAKNKQDYSC